MKTCSAGSVPDVSVCIANYNGEDLLDACISSVRNQDFDGTIEILVHDDASVDGSLAVLAERHADVIVLPSTRNVGYCASNNRMVAEAKGQYLLLLNNDATLRSDALRTLFSAGRQIAVPFALSLPQYDQVTSALVDRGVRLDLLHAPCANQVEACEKLAYVQGACFFIRRSDWLRLGGFPEWMQSNAEDTYLCAVVRLVGGRIQVAEGSGYDHRQGTSFGGNRIHESGLSTTYKRRYLSERNRAGLVLVCTPGPLAWILYAIQLLTLLVEGAVLAALMLDWRAWRLIYWAAVKDSLMLLGTLRVARRQIQGMRVIGLWAYLKVTVPVIHKIRLLWSFGLPRLR